MSFSKEWEEIYKHQKHLSIWPWTDLVSYIMRYFKKEMKNNKNLKILELGFGAGANIPFYKFLNFKFYGIDGSKTIVDNIRKAYPEYADNIKCADFTKNFPFNDTFNIIVDRASVSHNNTKAIKQTIKLIKKFLVPGGAFIGIDWFSKQHSEFCSNAEIIDNNTKIFHEGYFHKLGQVHFCNEKDIRQLFKDFQIIKIEHKVISDCTFNTDRHKNDTMIKKSAFYNFIAKIKE